jgi:hypothetical protein
MVRRFDQRPVPPEVVDSILDLARRSPSAGFAQGVDFLVLDTPETIATFWRLTDDPQFPIDAADLAHGPTVIVLPIADKRPYLARYAEADKAPFGLQHEDAWPVPFWEVDASMAAMTTLLGAVDAGLGGWFFGVFTGEPEVLATTGDPPAPPSPPLGETLTAAHNRRAARAVEDGAALAEGARSSDACESPGPPRTCPCPTLERPAASTPTTSASESRR